MLIAGCVKNYQALSGGGFGRRAGAGSTSGTHSKQETGNHQLFSVPIQQGR